MWLSIKIEADWLIPSNLFRSLSFNYTSFRAELSSTSERVLKTTLPSIWNLMPAILVRVELEIEEGQSRQSIAWLVWGKCYR